MGKAQSKHDESKHDESKHDESKHAESKHDESGYEESGDDELDTVKSVLEETGVSAAQNVIREKLEGWENVNVKIGVTGCAGVGKSCFINAIRGLDNEDDDAAAVGPVEMTFEPASYSFPRNPNITLVDLPGIGTPTFPDLVTYCEKVGLETYDTFLILSAVRFTENDLELAKKIISMGKSFFLIRTKIDEDERNENRNRIPDIEAMLEKIRGNLYDYTKGLEIAQDKIFLISNYYKDKWDFSRLIDAILDQLSTHQKEALTLSLRILSEKVLERKVKILRGQLWQVSFLFYASFPLDIAALPINAIINCVGAVKHFFQENGFVSKEDSDPLETTAPVGCASIPIALAIVGKKAKFYRSQLGLPEENSDQFKLLKPEFQDRMKEFYQKDEESVLKTAFGMLVKPLYLRSPHVRKTAVSSLEQLLEKMHKLALDILRETTTD